MSEYYVNLFSWSATCITQNLLSELSSRNITKIVDPFASSGFHAMLLYEGLKNEYTDYEPETNNIKLTKEIIVKAYDIQPETELLPWHYVEELNCYDIKWRNFKDFCLVISWADSNELAEYCLDNYKGKYIISIGNYDRKSNYYKKLSKNHLIYEKNCIMWWNSRELIQFYEILD